MENIEYDMNNLSDIEINELNNLPRFQKLDFLCRDFRNKLQSVQNLSEFDETMANINRYNLYLQRIISNYEFKTSVLYPDEQYISKLKKLKDLSIEMWENSKSERVVWERKEKEKKTCNENKPSKKPLLFAELFKPEFRSKLNVLFERLRLNGYTDENNNWIIKNGTNEPAKLFHYLKDRAVIITPKFKPAIECFYNEFGCEVVEKDNGNPRATTRKNADEAKNSVSEKEFNNFLLLWIDKK